MKAQIPTLYCTCGWHMRYMRNESGSSMRCPNDRCPNRGKRFKVPVVELEEVEEQKPKMTLDEVNIACDKIRSRVIEKLDEEARDWPKAVTLPSIIGTALECDPPEVCDDITGTTLTMTVGDKTYPAKVLPDGIIQIETEALGVDVPSSEGADAGDDFSAWSHVMAVVEPGEPVCPDCCGTGQIELLNTVEPCRTCSVTREP